MSSSLRARKNTRVFRLLDANSDGHVQREDLERTARRLAESLGLAPGSDARVALTARFVSQWDRIGAFDSDGDGKVSLSDWLAEADSTLKRPDFDEIVEAVAGQIFDLVDFDRDGLVNGEEYAIWIGAYGVSKEDAAAAFVKLDENGDRAISRAELVQAARDFHASEDPNAPGNWLYGPLA